MSLSGITRLIKKLRLTGSVANLPRSGRPKKLSMVGKASIDQQMRRNDETTSAKIRKKLEKQRCEDRESSKAGLSYLRSRFSNLLSHYPNFPRS